MMDETLAEVISSHIQTAEQLQEGTFKLIMDNETQEKADCFLYDKYVLIKYKVKLGIFREPTKIIY